MSLKGHRIEANDSASDAVLREYLIASEQERARLRRAGDSMPSTLEVPAGLSKAERERLSRLMECASQLEALAAAEEASSIHAPPSVPRSSLPIPERIGDYAIVRLIADGGFGAVYLARDETNGRDVAIKTPRPDMLLTDRLRERFVIEGRASATLDHPNIVSVYDAIPGENPAIVYEYCDGGTLSQLVAKQQGFNETTSLKLVAKLAAALQHAHTRGILHRDVKPGNVLLVRATDANRDASVEINGVHWIPKLGDFGLAKLIDESGVYQTQSGIVMGTPQFMAPEQAAGRISEFGTHTDIFSLGAILYWLLTGDPPFHRGTTLQTLRMIETESPETPRRRRPGISAKTEAVCLKCLRKPIDARYESAAALEHDLDRILKGEPVSVRPPSIGERLREWSHHHPRLAVFAVMIPLAAALGLWLQWSSNRSLQTLIGQLDTTNQELVAKSREAWHAQAIAEREKARYEQLFYATDLQLAHRALNSGDVKTYLDALNRHIPVGNATTDLRGPEWRLLRDLGHPPQMMIDQFPSAGYCVNLSRDGRFLVACGADSTVRVYDTIRWERVQIIETGQQEVNFADFSEDGSRIASAGDDGSIVVWDWQSGQEQLRFTAHDTLAYCVRFYRDGTRLASGGREPLVKLWDATTGAAVGELDGSGDPLRVEQLDVSDDGRWLASASFDGNRRVWDISRHQRIQDVPPIDSQRASSICLFPRDNEDWMLSGTLREGSRSNCRVVLEIVGGTEQRELPIHFDGIQSVAADASGQLAAAGDRSGRISVIDVNAAVRGERWWYPETIRKSWVGHTGRVYGLVMLDQGQTLISLGEDGQLAKWETDRRTGWTSLDINADKQLQTPVLHAAVSNEDRVVFLDGRQRHCIWDPGSNQLQAVLDDVTDEPLHLEYFDDRIRDSFAFHDDLLVGVPDGGPITCWRLEEGRAHLRWQRSVGEDSPGIYAIAVSPDGRRLAACRRGRPVSVFLIDMVSGEIVTEYDLPEVAADGCRSVAFSPASDQIACGLGQAVHHFNIWTGRHRVLVGHRDEVRQLCFVPESQLLLSGANDRTICVWDLSTGNLVRQLTGHRAAIECIGVHSVADRIVSSDDAGWVHIWTLSDDMPLLQLPPPAERTGHLSVGDRLMGVADGQVLFRQLLP